MPLEAVASASTDATPVGVPPPSATPSSAIPIIEAVEYSWMETVSPFQLFYASCTIEPGMVLLCIVRPLVTVDSDIQGSLPSTWPSSTGICGGMTALILAKEKLSGTIIASF